MGGISELLNTPKGQLRVCSLPYAVCTFILALSSYLVLSSFSFDLDYVDYFFEEIERKVVMEVDLIPQKEICHGEQLYSWFFGLKDFDHNCDSEECFSVLQTFVSERPMYQIGNQKICVRRAMQSYIDIQKLQLAYSQGEKCGEKQRECFSDNRLYCFPGDKCPVQKIQLMTVIDEATNNTST